MGFQGSKFSPLPRLACLVGWVYSFSLIVKEKPQDNERNRGGLTACLTLPSDVPEIATLNSPVYLASTVG